MGGIKEKDAVMFSIFAFIHVLLNLLAIGAGAAVLFGLLTGELFREWSICFLKISLLASIASLLAAITRFTSSAHHLLPAEQASMLSVYVAGAAVLAWHKYQLAGVWSSVFAATTTTILYLNVFVAIDHAFGDIGALKVSAQAHSIKTLLVTQLLFAMFFVVLEARAVKRFHSKPTYLF
jgi:hypothetical protein